MPSNRIAIVRHPESYHPTFAAARSRAIHDAAISDERRYIAQCPGLPAAERWCVQRRAPLIGLRWWAVDPDGYVIQHA